MRRAAHGLGVEVVSTHGVEGTRWRRVAPSERPDGAASSRSEEGTAANHAAAVAMRVVTSATGKQ